MAPRLEQAFVLRGYISKSDVVKIGVVRGAERNVFPVKSGWLKGSGLDATLVQGGSDWPQRDPDTGVEHLNVRTHGRTADGVGVFIYYRGFMKVDDALLEALTAGGNAQTTEFGDHEWFTSPIFEIGDPSLKWVESTVFVGQGRVIVEDDELAVEYKIYKVVN